MTFIIADGVLPDKNDRGYVLRRIMRRAILRAKTKLGFEEPFLDRAVPAVIEEMGDAYPELRDRESYIINTVRKEEELFRETLQRGIEKFNAAASAQTGKTFSGNVAFDLHSTYGFPLDLTQDMAEERGLVVDMEGYLQAEEEHRRVSSGQTLGVSMQVGKTGLAQVQQSQPPPLFLGYTETVVTAQVLALLKDGDLVESARAGEEVIVLLDKTPFYAESGGQVGDTGRLSGETGRPLIDVLDTQKDNGYWLHRIKLQSGDIAPGTLLRASVDIARRRAIVRNHTATHLLQAALRLVLGQDAHQAGSRVEPEQLRFDFTHSQAMTREQIQTVETLVNDRILSDTDVMIYNDVPLAEARERGAMALFGEKYGSVVRMVEIPGFSLELCGGIHLTHTATGGPVQDRERGRYLSGSAAYRCRDRFRRAGLHQQA